MCGRRNSRRRNHWEITSSSDRNKIIEAIKEILKTLAVSNKRFRQFYVDLKDVLEEACCIYDISRATYFRWLKEQLDKRSLRKGITPVNKLSETEEDEIINTFYELKEQKTYHSYRSIFYHLLHEGKYIASETTIYQVLKRRGIFKSKTYTYVDHKDGTPYGFATKPNQIWVADTTYLETNLKGKFFYLYCIEDLFSRKIMSWEIYDHDASKNWSEVLNKAYLNEHIKPDQLRFHTDNCSVYKGQLFQSVLKRLGIKYTHNRSHVSNDNAYMESFFATLKKKALVNLNKFPSGDIQFARRFIQRFIEYYNNEHLHSGLGYFTPNQVQNGEYLKLVEVLNVLKQEAKEKNPKRFARFAYATAQSIVHLIPTKPNKAETYEMAKGI